MGSATDVVLILAGVWLLCYRMFMRTSMKLRMTAMMFSQLACGLSLGMLAPLLPSEVPMPALFLLIMGGCCGVCSYFTVVIFVCLTVSTAMTSLLWDTAACSTAATDAVPYLHTSLMVTVPLLTNVIFLGTKAGPFYFERSMIPLNAGLIITVGLSGLIPTMGSLSYDELYSSTPCANGRASAAPLTLGIWFAISCVGAAIQAVLMRNSGSESEKKDNIAGLKTGLLGGEGAEATIVPRPNEVDCPNDRFRVLMTAIFAPEGADQSHLSEMDQKLVKVCREDEFERDRVLWGGGLI